MMRITMATGNKNKIREVAQMLEGTDFEVVSMGEAGFAGDIVEDGDSFAANAVIKARAVWQQVGGIVIADDSGLAVDYIGGEPGIYSARYMGEDTSYTIKNANIIERLKDAEEDERSARFVCAMAIVFEDGHDECFEETFEGVIAYEAAGENGFGYDPILYLPEKGCTSAQLSPEEKNAISHRGKALRKVARRLSEHRL